MSAVKCIVATSVMKGVNVITSLPALHAGPSCTPSSRPHHSPRSIGHSQNTRLPPTSTGHLGPGLHAGRLLCLFPRVPIALLAGLSCKLTHLRACGQERRRGLWAVGSTLPGRSRNISFHLEEWASPALMYGPQLPSPCR